jgi:CubicO group peptidase (beta-lactamase class C family)
VTTTLPDTLTAVETTFDRFHASGAAPGVAYGVIADGRLVHAGGRGTIRPDGSNPPDATTRYRIASMTKSFTAAAVLRLRDDDALRLDDEVARWVPELDRGTRWSTDAPPITLRQLLTMSAGLPTDDPWGDRQLGLDADAFLRVLGAGPALGWPAGTSYEYSNLGYAVLGLVVGRASGEGYRAYVERTILGPLGLTATTYDTDGVDPAAVAPGYVRRGDAWVEEAMSPDGAFAPMGGLFSTVRDLATWVSAFLGASPSRDEPDPGVPLVRSTLREMQQLQRTIPPELRWTSAGAPPVPIVSGYGLGLFVIHDAERGRVVAHSGGLPGYGSNMRWHPATGLGIVAAANGTYAQLSLVCRDALDALIDGDYRPRHRARPWPQTGEARAAIERLVERWDDELATATFTMNVALDEPFDVRRAQIDRIREVHGRLWPDPSEPVVTDTPAHLGWWLVGERGGRVYVEIVLGPERPARVQWLELTSVPDPSPALTAIAGRVVELLGEGRPSWPAELPLDETVDRERLDRELRAADAIFGPLALGAVIAGDGAAKASWRLTGPRGRVTLAVELADDRATIAAISLVPDGLTSPVEPG